MYHHVIDPRIHTDSVVNLQAVVNPVSWVRSFAACRTMAILKGGYLLIAITSAFSAS